MTEYDKTDNFFYLVLSYGYLKYYNRQYTLKDALKVMGENFWSGEFTKVVLLTNNPKIANNSDIIYDKDIDVLEQALIKAFPYDERVIHKAFLL